MASSAEEKGTAVPENPNGKTIDVVGEFCDMWGYGRVVQKLKTTLIDNLKSKGYTINYTIKPLPGGKGEYFIYKMEGEKKKIIFSNKEEDQKEGVIYGGCVTSSNVEEVIKKLIE